LEELCEWLLLDDSVRMNWALSLFFTLERVLVRVLRNPSVDVLECVLECLLALGVGRSSADVRGVEALEADPEEVHELVLPAL
jgi:hypothetical protein